MEDSKQSIFRAQKMMPGGTECLPRQSFKLLDEDSQMSNIPKYTILEIERRWLVDPNSVGRLDTTVERIIDDLYIDGTHLRLRKMIGPGSRIEYKFGKKYGKISPISEPITNLYLEKHEYLSLSNLPGRSSRKRRYSLDGGSLDVYELPNRGVMVFEVEFSSEALARAYSPPPFVVREITGEPDFTGAEMAKYDD